VPLELQIIRAREFIRIGAQGKPDLAASFEALKQLAAACRRRGIDQALLDVRDVHSHLTPTELATLIGSFREIGFTHRQRLAVLYDGDPEYRVRIFAFIGTLSGWTVRAFGDFEEALLWLSSGEQSEAVPTHSVPAPGSLRREP
jgi:hypothetical protein